MSNWISRSDLTSEQYQNVFNQNLKLGYFPISIDGYESNGEIKFSAIWNIDNQDKIARHNLTSTEFDECVAQYSKDGYTIDYVSGYTLNNTPYFAGIWTKRSGDYQVWINMTKDGYQQKFEQFVGEGYSATRVNAYLINGTPYYTGIWEKKSGTFVANHSMSLTEYQTLFDTYSKDGYVQTSLSEFSISDAPYFAAIWYKLNEASWVRSDMDRATLESYNLEYIAQGYQQVELTGFNLNGSMRYSCIWYKLSNSFPAWGPDIQSKIANLAMGYSYVISKFGMVVEKGNYGYTRAKWETDGGDTLWSNDTQMSIASVSKAITATAFFTYIQNNFNEWMDKPFWTYVPEVTTWGDNVKQVTFRNLMEMKSGMAAPGNLYGDYWTEIKAWCGKPADPAKIGKDKDYNNNNYAIMLSIMQQITGKTYSNYVQDHVFAPLGMNQMSDTPDTVNQTLTYKTTDLQGQGNGYAWPHLTVSTATGGWVGSTNQLMQFLIGVRDSQLLKPEITESMLNNEYGWFQPWTNLSLAYRAKNGGLVNRDGRGLNTAVVHFNDGYDAVIFINTKNAENKLWQPGTLIAVHNQLFGGNLSVDAITTNGIILKKD